jgi:hypothetical protein
MDSATIEQLRRQYTGRKVMIDGHRPEWARVAGKPGRVFTINYNGRALVQFEGVNTTYYDIDPELLKVVDEQPTSPPEEQMPSAAS